MIMKKISNDANVYIYDNIENYLTNVFLIQKKSRIYIIDTYCGSHSMIPILNILKDTSPTKEVIVINTHFHWDHVWGNYCFKENKIISHELCKKLLEESWETQINKNKKYICGKVEKCLPNITFKDNYIFEEDSIELFHSPGHTIDSISVFDHEEKILYVGDNLEKPIIYVESKDINTYINTLENYFNYHPQKIVAGHTLDLTEKDILDTIKYLKALLNGEKMHFKSKYMLEIHKENLNILKKV